MLPSMYVTMLEFSLATFPLIPLSERRPPLSVAVSNVAALANKYTRPFVVFVYDTNVLPSGRKLVAVRTLQCLVDISKQYTRAPLPHASTLSTSRATTPWVIPENSVNNEQFDRSSEKTVGEALGLDVGHDDGAVDGTTDGFADGLEEGNVDGTVVGYTLGHSLG